MRKTAKKTKYPCQDQHQVDVFKVLKEVKNYKPSKECIAILASLDRMRKLLNEW